MLDKEKPALNRAVCIFEDNDIRSTICLFFINCDYESLIPSSHYGTLFKKAQIWSYKVSSSKSSRRGCFLYLCNRNKLMAGMSRASSSWRFQRKVNATRWPLQSVKVISVADRPIAGNKANMSRYRWYQPPKYSWSFYQDPGEIPFTRNRPICRKMPYLARLKKVRRDFSVRPKS